MRYLLTICLMIAWSAMSSQDLAALVAQKFNAYQQKNQQFKTALVFSQNKYVPGDTAFFAAWFLTEAGQLVGGDQILNLDMIDSEGKVVQHILFRVRGGMGANQVIIGTNTRPGIYIMSAYNDCMKASDPRFAFRKQITVVNRNALAVKASSQAEASKMIRVRTTSNEFVDVTVAIPGQHGKELVLAVTSGGQLYFTAAFTFNKKDSVTVRLPRKDLPEGTNLLSVVSKESVLATQNFYLPLSLRFNIDLLRDTVSTRQRVLSEIRITDATNKPVSVPFTVSVVNSNIDLDDDVNVKELLNEPVVPWADVLSGKSASAARPPKLITMYGQAFLDGSDTPVPESAVVYCFMKKNRFAFETGVQENGRLEMVFLDFFGSDEMFYHVEHEGKELRNATIRWTPNSMKHDPALIAEETGSIDSYAGFIAKKRVIDRSFDYFSPAVGAPASKQVTPLETEFENLGTVIDLHEYKIFPTMTETIRELIPRLSYRRAGGRDIVKVNLSEIDLKATGGPLYIIDNSITKDPAHFLSLIPDDLISIRVVHDPKELSRFMPVSRNGIVVVKTKKGNGKTIVKENVLPIAGLSAPVEFVPLKARRPEFRSTVSWQPFAKTDANGKATVSFFTSDDAGTMKIRIQGVYGGQLFSAEKEIVVNLDAAH